MQIWNNLSDFRDHSLMSRVFRVFNVLSSVAAVLIKQIIIYKDDALHVASVLP